MLPSGLRESDRLPAANLHAGDQGATSGHDINISEAEAARLVGPGVFDQVKALTLRIYAEGVAYAE